MSEQGRNLSTLAQERTALYERICACLAEIRQSFEVLGDTYGRPKDFSLPLITRNELKHFVARLNVVQSDLAVTPDDAPALAALRKLDAEIYSAALIVRRRAAN